MSLELFQVMAMSTEGPPAWLLLAGPAGAGGTWYALWRYYRNADKKHEFERDTLISARPVAGSDTRVDHIGRTRQARIDNGNESDYRERVRRIG